MNGMMLATYVLKAQQQADRDQRGPFPEPRNTTTALRSIAPLLASFAGVGLWVFILEAVR
jgi:hypothetical protein